MANKVTVMAPATVANVATFSNAMDVGDPSNFARLNFFYKETLNSILE